MCTWIIITYEISPRKRTNERKVYANTRNSNCNNNTINYNNVSQIKCLYVIVSLFARRTSSNNKYFNSIYLCVCVCVCVYFEVSFLYALNDNLLMHLIAYTNILSSLFLFTQAFVIFFANALCVWMCVY